MFLVDTNVVSSRAPHRKPSQDLVDWIDANSNRLHLSAMSVLEIEDGIATLRRKNATRKAEALAEWIDALLHLYGSRVLPLDTSVARIAGALSDKARGLGFSPGLADIVIAATAVKYDLTLLTRNTKDFSKLGVRLRNPFDGT